MLRKILQFIILAVLLEYGRGVSQKDLLQYVQDLALDMRNNFKRFETEIQDMKTADKPKNYESLEMEIRKLNKENRLLQDELMRIKYSMQNCSRNCKTIVEPIHANKRGIISHGTIAFSAVLTPNFDKSIGTNHVFIYDHVESNVGGAYNVNDGIFMTPETGTYAFLWTIFAEGRYAIGGQFGEIETELVVNSQRRGYAFTDTEVQGDDDQATGFVIVQLNQGDVVFVRSIGSPQGTFQHDYHGMWTFSGWKIA